MSDNKIKAYIGTARRGGMRLNIFNCPIQVSGVLHLSRIGPSSSVTGRSNRAITVRAIPTKLFEITYQIRRVLIEVFVYFRPGIEETNTNSEPLSALEKCACYGDDVPAP